MIHCRDCAAPFTHRHLPPPLDHWMVAKKADIVAVYGTGQRVEPPSLEELYDADATDEERDAFMAAISESPVPTSTGQPATAEEHETFEAALERARRQAVPVIALRPRHEFPDELDDVVVENVMTFRAEAMSNKVWWMACRFANGEELVFHVTTASKPARLVFSATMVPEHVDWDELRRSRS
jgi:hypothetical protein